MRVTRGLHRRHLSRDSSFPAAFRRSSIVASTAGRHSQTVNPEPEYWQR
jgi:hypothetical protein